MENTMRDFQGNFIYQPTGTVKKRHKTKAHYNGEEICKCSIPFVKFHHYDCPMANKSCPIHGSSKEKVEKRSQQCMIISFHPSSKTDRLFQPIKALLARSPETKVNLQYYSPKASSRRESTKHCKIQTSVEDLKKSLGNNFFVEKTKSFVAGKTNRMKKLKQCFYSPCSSIAHKSLSEISIKENSTEIMDEEVRETESVFRSVLNEKLSREIDSEPSVRWLCYNNLESNDRPNFSREKLDSDYVTVTQQDKNNVINHKIFEIKYKKDAGDFPVVTPNKSHNFVFAAKTGEPTQKSPNGFSDKKTSEPKSRVSKNEPSSAEKKSTGSEKRKKKQSKKENSSEEGSSSGKSQSSESGSVYFTPFILMPAESEESESDATSREQSEKGVQVEDNAGKKSTAPQQTQTSLTYVSTSSALVEYSSRDILGSRRSVTSDESPTTNGQEIKTPSSFISKSTDYPEGTAVHRAITVVEDAAPGYRERSSDAKTESNAEKEMQRLPTGPNEGDREPDTGTLRLSYQNPNDQCYVDFKSVVLEIVRNARSSEVLARRDQFTQTPNHLATQSPDFEVMEIYSRNEETLKRTAEAQTNSNPSTSQKMYTTKNLETDEIQNGTSQEGTASHSSKEVQTSGRNVYLDSVTICKTYDGSEFLALEPSKDTYVLKRFPSSENKQGRGEFHSDGYLYETRKGTPEETEEPAYEVSNVESVESIPSDTDFSIFDSNKADNGSLGMYENLDQYFIVDEKEEDRSPVSDLSEITKMICKLFDRMGEEPLKFCECQTSSYRETRALMDRETMTEQEQSKPLNKELVTQGVQTTFNVIIDQSADDKSISSQEKTNQVRVRQSVLLDEKNQSKNIFICKICAKQISTYTMNVGTSTEFFDDARPAAEPQGFTQVIHIKSVKQFQNYEVLDQPSESINKQDKIKENSTSPSGIPQESPVDPMNKNRSKNSVPTSSQRKAVGFHSYGSNEPGTLRMETTKENIQLKQRTINTGPDKRGGGTSSRDRSPKNTQESSCECCECNSRKPSLTSSKAPSTFSASAPGQQTKSPSKSRAPYNGASKKEENVETSSKYQKAVQFQQTSISKTPLSSSKANSKSTNHHPRVSNASSKPRTHNFDQSERRNLPRDVSPRTADPSQAIHSNFSSIPNQSRSPYTSSTLNQRPKTPPTSKTTNIGASKNQEKFPREKSPECPKEMQLAICIPLNPAIAIPADICPSSPVKTSPAALKKPSESTKPVATNRLPKQTATERKTNTINRPPAGKKNSPGTSGVYFPAIISAELMKSLNLIKKFQGESSPKSSITSASKQKRTREKGKPPDDPNCCKKVNNDDPDEINVFDFCQKKIDEPSSFQFECSQGLSHNPDHDHRLVKERGASSLNEEFVWTPSSEAQILVSRRDNPPQIKHVKSEEFAKDIRGRQILSLGKKGVSGNLFAPKSLSHCSEEHEKPFQRLCKSLTLLKRATVLQENKSKPSIWSEKDLTPNEEETSSAKQSTWMEIPENPEEFLEEVSQISETASLQGADSAQEGLDSLPDECFFNFQINQFNWGRISEEPRSPSHCSTDTSPERYVSDVATTSTSFNKFWYNNETKRKVVQKKTTNPKNIQSRMCRVLRKKSTEKREDD